VFIFIGNGGLDILSELLPKCGDWHFLNVIEFSKRKWNSSENIFLSANVSLFQESPRNCQHFSLLIPYNKPGLCDNHLINS
jgi:hypothetical protein